MNFCNSEEYEKFIQRHKNMWFKEDWLYKGKCWECAGSTTNIALSMRKATFNTPIMAVMREPP